MLLIWRTKEGIGSVERSLRSLRPLSPACSAYHGSLPEMVMYGPLKPLNVTV
jgi:hypothetical protein